MVTERHDEPERKDDDKRDEPERKDERDEAGRDQPKVGARAAVLSAGARSVEAAEAAAEHLNAVRTSFMERYRLTEGVEHESEGLAAIEAAIAAGPGADIEGVATVLRGYNLYPHHWEEISAHLKAASEALSQGTPPPPEGGGGEEIPLSRMTRAELVAEAGRRGLEPKQNATVAELRDFLTENNKPGPEPGRG